MSKEIRPNDRWPTDSRDLRPQVLLLFALVILLLAYHRQNSPAPAPPALPPQKTIQLEGVATPGLRRIAAGLRMAALYRLSGVPAPSESLSPEEISNYSTIILVSDKQPEVYSGLLPRQTPAFFLPVPVNRADAELLETLPGIGAKLAGRIIASREVYGPFRSMDELLTVKGIGPKKLEALAEHLLVE